MPAARAIALELRIAQVAVAVTLGVLLAFGIVSFIVNKQHIEERERAAGHRELAVAAVRVEDALAQATTELASLARNPLTANALVDTVGRDTYMAPFMRSHWLASTAGRSISLCDFAGAPVTSAGDTPDLCTKAAQTVELEGLDDAVASITGAAGSEQLLMAFPVIFVGTGQSEGTVVASYPVRELVRTAQGLDPSEFEYVFRAAARGPLQAPDGRRASGLMTLAQALSLPPPLDGLGIRIEQYADAAATLQPLRELAWTYLGIAVAAALMVGLLARLAAKRVARPIVVLARASRVLARDINARLDLPRPRETEVRQLSDAFQTMVGALRESQTGLECRVEQRTAELRDSEARSRAIIDNALDCIVTIDQDGLISEFNPAAERTFGHRREDVVGRPMAELIIPVEHRRSHQEGIQRLQATGHGPILGQRIEVPALRASGEQFAAELAVTPVRIAGRQYFTAYLRDISNRKHAEALLHEHTRRLDAVFSLSPDGFVVLDAEDRLSFVNPAFQEMIGLPAERLLGLHAAEFEELLRASADPREEVPAATPAGADGSEPRAETLYLLRPKARILQRRVRRGGGDLAQTIMYFRDISHEREVDRMKSEFLATAAHELRTPMASILGFSELLLMDDHDAPTRRDLLQTINAQSQLLTGMVNELLDLARIEARRDKDFQLEWMQPGELCRQTVDALLIPGDRRELTLRVQPSLPAVRVDAAKMQQALTNLIANAFKYSPAGGEVVLEVTAVASADGPAVRLSVSDQGIGMTAEQLQRACDRFYRADASGQIPGTGLGLSLVKEIVELHGGQLRLESEFGKGTTATVELPASPG